MSQSKNLGAMVASLLLALVGCLTGTASTANENAAEPPPIEVEAAQKVVRSIALPGRHVGCDKFRNGVVRDKSALAREFAAMKEEPGDPFRSAIEAAHLDFETEALVLLRHTEGRLGGGIRFGEPSLFRSKGSDPRSVLTLRIESDERDPQVASQTAVVEHCYAVAVKTVEVDMVILSSNQQVVFATTLGSSSPTY